jgi:hypothetical protein
MVALAAMVMGGVASAEAQVWERSDEGWCDEDWGGRDNDRFCMVLSADLDDPERLTVDGGLNGGVQVNGWSRDVVEVRAKVWANARSVERAQELARDVRVVANGGHLSAEGTDTGRRESWGVSWELMVPHSTDLNLETHNGGITISDVRGQIRFDARLNGGVHLSGTGGDVEGHTTNGGLHVVLDGNGWDGSGLDVETTNGGVTVSVPRNYSAQLETGTVNGGIDVDFPVTVQGRIGRSLDLRLGEGGRTVRVMTTNRGLKIVRSVGRQIR